MTKTIDIEQLMELRTYYQRQAQRCADAIELAREAAKFAQQAGRTLGKVRARAMRGRPFTGTSKSADYRRQKATGTRPTDVVRRLFIEANGKPLTRAELLERSGLIGTISGGPPNLSAEGRANRMLGLSLSTMKKNREIKETPDGFVARKLQPIAGEDNGARP